MIDWWWLIPALIIGGFLGQLNAKNEVKEKLEELGIDPSIVGL